MSRTSSSLVSALVALDAASPDPLHRQLYGKLRSAILAGRISPGAQIPSSRDLARELGVARNTVLNAVEQLIAEGYLQGEHGSGTYVNRTLPDDTLRVPRLQASTAQRARKRSPLSLRSRGLITAPPLLLSAGRPKPFQPAVPAVLLDEARRELAGLLDAQVSDAGLHAIGWLPQGVDDRSAARLAAAEGVDAVPLSSFYREPGK